MVTKRRVVQISERSKVGGLIIVAGEIGRQERVEEAGANNSSSSCVPLSRAGMVDGGMLLLRTCLPMH